ncbi:zinc-binding dehydrogenase, partial [Candidatus Sumerlaeota bacterium]|nr:zinc-binding dehydrogenase [Candidatus Sumerlaeota bacterium]
MSRTGREAGKILVRNALTMIYPGVDVALVNRSETGAKWLSLGRLAIGQVQQAGDTEDGEAASKPKGGDWIFWAGPHADFGLLDPARDVWAPVSEVDPLLLPAGIGAEAESGLRPALESLDRAPVYAVVVGQGMLGHLAAQWLKGRGCSVTVVENSPKRLEFSKYSGLRQKADTHNVDWKKRVEGWNRDGIDLLVDACGNPRPIVELAPSLRSGGAICRLGRWRPPELPPEVAGILQGVGGRDFGPSPSF